MMLAFILAATIAQLSPAPQASLAPVQSSASPAPSAEAGSPAPPGGSTFPTGMTRRMPLGALHVVTGDAVIRNSGSTNIAGYTIVVHQDYSADVALGGAVQHKTLGEAQAKWLFAKLKADEPLSSLAVGRCMKSASFGSVTTIAFEGQSTADLSCGGGDQVRELDRTIGVIVNQLGVAPGIGRLRRHLL